MNGSFCLKVPSGQSASENNKKNYNNTKATKGCRLTDQVKEKQMQMGSNDKRICIFVSCCIAVVIIYIIHHSFDVCIFPWAK